MNCNISSLDHQAINSNWSFLFFQWLVINVFDQSINIIYESYIYIYIYKRPSKFNSVQHYYHSSVNTFTSVPVSVRI